MRRFWLLSIALVLLTPAAHAESVALGFDQIPKLIRERNKHAQSAELLKESAEVGRGHLNRSFLPYLNGSIGAEAFRTGSRDVRREPYGQIELRANLFRGGRDSLEDKLADKRSEVANANAERTVRAEVRKARVVYWNLVSGREVARLLEAALDENEQNLKAALARIRAGAATDTDRIGFEMHRIELEQDLARLRLKGENDERDLVALLGLTEGARIETDRDVSHDHDDNLLSMKGDLTANPVLNGLRAQSEESDLKASQQARWWTPSIDVYANHGLHTFRSRDYDPQSERMESVVGVQMSFDFFDGYSRQVGRQQRNLEALSLQKELQQASQEISAETKGAQAELQLTHDLIHKSEDAIKQSKLYLTRTMEKYRRGVANSPEVLSAAERNFAMHRRFAELRRDYQLARSALLESFGH